MSSPSIPREIQPQLVLKARPLPRNIRNRRRAWFWIGLIWQVTHYFLGLLAIVASVAAGVLEGQDQKTARVVVVTVAGVCTAVVSFVNPARLGSGFTNAWRHLDSAARRYEAGDGREQLEQVNKAVDDGEKMIAANEPTVSAMGGQGKA